ncbi:MAG TPA: tetratricopeptide repeat protein [Rhodocyclaceae bacterium]|nr:tetratricopeptide repeat protein [Rhodocyclaceae bacterium]
MPSALNQQARRAEQLSHAGNWRDAILAWRELIAAAPRNARAHAGLGLSLAQAGHAADAIDAYGKALHLGLAADEVAAGIGIVFCLRQQYDVARENLRMAVTSNPHNIAAWANLTTANVRLGRFQDALQSAHQALALEPDNASVASSLGTLFKDLGHAAEAIDWLRQAIANQPANTDFRSNLMWAMLHADHVSAADILNEGRSHALLLPEPGNDISVSDSNNRKLRIGWVSSDLRNHAVGRFVIPLLPALQANGIDSIAFNTGNHQDDWSARAKAGTSAWHDVGDRNDVEIASLITREHIDILIDLGGHSDGGRLGVFARRPAPIQMSWLGFPGTSGLEQIDYVLVPPDLALLNDGWSSERPLSLAQTYYVRDAAELRLPANQDTPCLRSGQVTFGSLNNLAKVSDSAVAAWSTILHSVLDSRMILIAAAGDEELVKSDVLERFAHHGITADRLDIRPRMAPDRYLATYEEIDLLLDAFPFTGGTTGCDALCRGTPFVTLTGEALHTRLGAALLRTAGLNDLITGTTDDYVARAVALGNAPDALQALRQRLHANLPTCALFDLVGFAQDFAVLMRGTMMQHRAG